MLYVFMDVLWVFYGCSMHVLWMFYGCSGRSMDLWNFYGSSMDFDGLLNGCLMDLAWLLMDLNAV